MTENECVRCGRPTPDGYACHPCSRLAAAWLAEIADMAMAARDVAQRQARRGSGGAASGKPGSSLPIDLGATARLDAVQGSLTTWARHIGEERGVNQAEINADGLTWLSRSPGWVKDLRGVQDDLSGIALWLAGHCEWMRHRPEADEWLSDVEACARVVRGIARGPAAQRYLGPCGALIIEPADPALICDCDHDGLDPMFHLRPCPIAMTDWRHACEGDVYGPQGGQRGTCRTCGAQVAQDERRAWLDEQVADRAYRAAHIADAYRINVNTIRSWALDRPEERAENGNIIRRARPAKLRIHGYDREGKPLYLVGDVLELAREAAARRAENEAKRARREAAEMGA